MLDDKRSHGLWEAGCQNGPDTMQLASDITADVVIIGGGYTGLSAALHVAAAGRQAVVLEAEEIGFGGSGRNVGLVNAGLWIMPEAVPSEIGDTYGERLLDLLGEAPALVFDLIERFSIDCDVVRNGTLHCAVGQAGLIEIQERAQQWHGLGVDVEVLDERQAFEAIGSRAYTGALLDRRAGTIQPLAYARGLARAAQGAGASLYCKSPAVAASHKGGQWEVQATGGSVSAPFVIVATDAYAVGPFCEVKAAQVMLPYFNLATSPLTDNVRKTILPGGQGAWDTKRVLSSFRFDAAGRLVFGSVGALRGTGTTVHRGWGRRELQRLFPQLSEVNFEHEWFGNIGMNDNAIPRFHRHAPNVFSVSGFNGRGIGPGTTFGRELARLALGEISAEDFALPLGELGRPFMRQGRTAIYEVGSQLLHLAGARTAHP